MRRAGLLLALLAAGGCSPPVGSVAGRVTVGGQPMKLGLISFLPDAGTRDPVNVVVNGGAYSAEDVPCGRARVFVVEDDDPSGAPRQRYNAKFRSPERSGLELVVKPGPNRFDVDLGP